MTDDSQCPVCLSEGTERTTIASAVPYSGSGLEERTHADGGYRYNCRRCGEFVVTELDVVNLKSPTRRPALDPSKLSALVRERTVHGLPRFWLRDGMDPYGDLQTTEPFTPIGVDELIKRWPTTVAERLDHMLANFAAMCGRAGQSIEWTPDDIAVAFAADFDEADYHLRALRSRGDLIQPAGDELISPRGWARLDELRTARSSPTNPVFVAMWFGDGDDYDRMFKVYSDGIEAGINDAGYVATREDQAHHNDWIMDRMLARIRLAPFVVADFTGHRHGVYFEAGFARGLGLEVIHTCEAAALSATHFDTAQVSHVRWHTTDELRQRLCDRILATIGRGPFFKEIRDRARSLTSGGTPTPD